MTQHRIAHLPGDGIGPEVTAQGRRVLDHLAARDGVSLRWIDLDLGAERYLADGTTLPDDVFAVLRDEVDAIYLGALGDPRIPDHAHARDILLGLRTRLDLYVNLRPIHLLDARRSPLKGKTEADVDLVVFRENTEGLYTGIGGQFKRDTPDEVAIEAELNTRKGVERIVRAAFDHAVATGRHDVCLADKSNALRHGHDLWQRVFWQTATQHPTVRARHLYVDALVMELVRAPETFDVIVTNNLFGDIVTDLGAQLQGGIGLAASANLHPGRRPGLFEPVHGSAPALAGTGTANPIAAVLSAGMLAADLGHGDWQEQVVAAVTEVLRADEVTAELGGTLRTAQVGDRILARLDAA